MLQVYVFLLVLYLYTQFFMRLELCLYITYVYNFFLYVSNFNVLAALFATDIRQVKFITHTHTLNLTVDS